MGERRGAYRVLVRKPEGKSPFARPRRRWVDNRKMDFFFRKLDGGWGME
jgi:hypothetical protein